MAVEPVEIDHTLIMVLATPAVAVEALKRRAIFHRLEISRLLFQVPKA